MSTVQARNIVRMILGTSEVPLSTKQLFDLAGKRYADLSVTPTAIKYPSPPVKSKAYFERVMPPTPPRPTTHPIYSITQLKNRVLSDLAARNEIQKIYTIKPPTSSHHQADPTKLATATPTPTSKSKSKSNVTPTITTHTTKAFLWRIHPESLSKPLPASPSQPEIEWKWVSPTKPPGKTHAQMYPLPKNIHLNLRRRRARVGKVMRERIWIKKVARAVARGAKALAKKEEKEALLKAKVKKAKVKKPKAPRLEPVAV